MSGLFQPVGFADEIFWGVTETVSKIIQPVEVWGRDGNGMWIKELHMKKGFRINQKPLSVELRGFEPLTLSMPWRCATSCAIAPWS